MVNVLISTYNGARYIRQQLDSILTQTYKDVTIYVRDDGSDDETVSIIKEYGQSADIKLICGKNIGYGRSFLWLLEHADTGDYWAFCDQDDVWESDKLARAVARLESMSPDIPNMYVHDFWITDERLTPISRYGNDIEGYDFRMAITECLHMGFSTVFNAELRRYMLMGNIDNIPTHDWWEELIAMEFGNIYVDDYIGAWHRRLDESISENNIGNRVKWFFRAMKGGSEIPYICREFYETFNDKMKDEDRHILELFVNNKNRFNKSVKKALYPKRWRTSIASEIVVRMLMIMGKI